MFNPVCPNCATTTLFGAAYCPHCGHGLARNDTPPPVKPAETAETIAQTLTDTQFVFTIWVASLALLVMTGIVHKLYGMLDVLLISGLLMFYIWAFLLVKLDQLANAVGKNPAFWVYCSLLLPLMGNFISFYLLRQYARLKIRELE